MQQRYSWHHPLQKTIQADISGLNHHYYEFEDGDEWTFEHLSALKFYTDWTDLCTTLGGTFRKYDIMEPVDSIKKRNAALK